MRGRPAPLAILLVAACYSPPEMSDPDATGGGGMGTAGDDAGATSTLGQTSSPDDDGGDPTGLDPTTSTDGLDDSGDGMPMTSGSESSDSGSVPVVCGDGVIEGDEACDDANAVDGDFCAADCTIETRVFGFTGAVQTFEVPAWVSEIVIEAYGAQGGSSVCCLDDGTRAPDDDGGPGGFVIGTIAVMQGTEVAVFVGGQGTLEGPGGFNGGGGGGEWGAGGGGASDVRIGGQTLANRVLVAGGGGGGNCGCPDHGAGGPGGGLSGNAGISLQQWLAPGGGTQTAGGIAGDPPGQAGGPGVGGSWSGDAYHVAGGGGGWFGGGSAFAAGGGGGSSYLGAATDAATQADTHAGDGEVRITPVAP